MKTLTAVSLLILSLGTYSSALACDGVKENSQCFSPYDFPTLEFLIKKSLHNNLEQPPFIITKDESDQTSYNQSLQQNILSDSVQRGFLIGQVSTSCSWSQDKESFLTRFVFVRTFNAIIDCSRIRANLLTTYNSEYEVLKAAYIKSVGTWEERGENYQLLKPSESRPTDPNQ